MGRERIKEGGQTDGRRIRSGKNGGEGGEGSQACVNSRGWQIEHRTNVVVVNNQSAISQKKFTAILLDAHNDNIRSVFHLPLSGFVRGQF